MDKSKSKNEASHALYNEKNGTQIQWGMSLGKLSRSLLIIFLVDEMLVLEELLLSSLNHQYSNYSNTCLKRSPKKKTIIWVLDRLLLNAGQKYCRMPQRSILQNFRPSFIYHSSLKSLFCLFGVAA